MGRSLRSTTLHFGSYNFLPYDTNNRLGLELVRSNEKRLRGLPAAQDKDAFAYKCWYHGSSLMVSQLPSSLFTINGPWELMFYVNITVVIAAKFSDGRGPQSLWHWQVQHALSTCIDDLQTKCFEAGALTQNCLRYSACGRMLGFYHILGTAKLLPVKTIMRPLAPKPRDLPSTVISR